MNKFFPEPQKIPEIKESKVDTVIIQQLIDQDRKINQLENLISTLRDDLRERDQAPPRQQVQSNSQGSINVVELSQVIEANDLASANRHKKELEEQRKALSRDFSLKLEAEILKVENKYRPVINQIKELSAHLEEQRQMRRDEEPARLLWITCQSLLNQLAHEPHKPIEKHPAYEKLKEFAANNNELAVKVLDSLPAKAIKEGVESELSLIQRYNTIETVCKRVAMVDENGGDIGAYLLSFLRSLLIKETVRVFDEEVNGQVEVDPSTWQTVDILARVKYCLVKHNLEQAVRYANQLQGQARVVAKDWIRDARLHLETKQAFNIMSAHAESTVLYFINQT